MRKLLLSLLALLLCLPSMAMAMANSSVYAPPTMTSDGVPGNDLEFRYKAQTGSNLGYWNDASPTWISATTPKGSPTHFDLSYAGGNFTWTVGGYSISYAAPVDYVYSDLYLIARVNQDASHLGLEVDVTNIVLDFTLTDGITDSYDFFDDIVLQGQTGQNMYAGYNFYPEPFFSAGSSIASFDLSGDLTMLWDGASWPNERLSLSIYATNDASAVPEPSTFALLGGGLGLAGLAAIRRKKAA